MIKDKMVENDIRYYCGNQAVGVKEKIDSHTWLCYLFEKISCVGLKYSMQKINTANLWRKRR